MVNIAVVEEQVFTNFANASSSFTIFLYLLLQKPFPWSLRWEYEAWEDFVATDVILGMNEFFTGVLTAKTVSKKYGMFC